VFLNLILQEDCLACSNSVKKLSFKLNTTLQNVIDFLKEDGEYRMKNPGVAANIGGKHKNLFLSILPSTKDNLKKSLQGNVTAIRELHDLSKCILLL